MSSTRESNAYAPSEEGLAVLWNRWDAGEYAHHVHNLLGFVEEKHEFLRRAVAESDGSEGCLAAVRALLIQLGTVHPKNEMRDQMKAIHDEIWYRGERGEHDRSQIVANWTKLHAASWRRWRIMEYLFVLDREADAVISRVCPHTSGSETT